MWLRPKLGLAPPSHESSCGGQGLGFPLGLQWWGDRTDVETLLAQASGKAATQPRLPPVGVTSSLRLGPDWKVYAIKTNGCRVDRARPAGRRPGPKCPGFRGRSHSMAKFQGEVRRNSAGGESRAAPGPPTSTATPSFPLPLGGLGEARLSIPKAHTRWHLRAAAEEERVVPEEKGL